MINGIIEDRVKVLEKGVQTKGNAHKIQTLEEAIKNVCMVVDVVMKKVVMATVSGMDKIKKQQKKAGSDGEDLAGKMEQKAMVKGTVEDLVKAWKLIEDA